MCWAKHTHLADKHCSFPLRIECFLAGSFRFRPIHHNIQVMHCAVVVCKFLSWDSPEPDDGLLFFISTFFVELHPPQNAVVLGVTENSIEITWDPILGATRYNVTVSPCCYA